MYTVHNDELAMSAAKPTLCRQTRRKHRDITLPTAYWQQSSTVAIQTTANI